MVFRRSYDEFVISLRFFENRVPGDLRIDLRYLLYSLKNSRNISWNTSSERENSIKFYKVLRTGVREQ